MSEVQRAFRLRGASAGAALDWLHVHADVRGAVEDDDEVTVWLPGALPALPQCDLQIEELPSAQANASATGLEHDAAILVAPDLMVRPPWVERLPGFTGIELVVPRGMAFGSGEHGSTQAALLCLHAVWPATVASFADVGTGSGILALYAQQRGAARVSACDIETEAVAAARELLPEAEVALGGAEMLSTPADLVVANLTAGELLAALPSILRQWTRRSLLVLSGIRAGEVDAVLAAVSLPVRHRLGVGDFHAFAFTASSRDRHRSGPDRRPC